MAISANNITLDSLTLPYELVWVDQYSWSGLVANSARTCGGVQILEQNELSGEAGRPITLSSDQAWITKTDLATLFTWSQILDKQLTLTLHDGTVKTVRFNIQGGAPITATPVKPIAEQAATDEFILTLKLLVA